MKDKNHCQSFDFINKSRAQYLVIILFLLWRLHLSVVNSDVCFTTGLGLWESALPACMNGSTVFFYKITFFLTLETASICCKFTCLFYHRSGTVGVSLTWPARTFPGACMIGCTVFFYKIQRFHFEWTLLLHAII